MRCFAKRLRREKDEAFPSQILQSKMRAMGTEMGTRITISKPIASTAIVLPSEGGDSEASFEVCGEECWGMSTRDSSKRGLELLEVF